MRSLGRATPLLVAALLAGAAGGARAQSKGFQLERYEPSPAGGWFFAAEHPWYSSTRWVAAGLTLDYGHNALLGGAYDSTETFIRQVSIVEHMLVGHVDVAGSFLDRVQVSASLPVVLFESGTPGFGAKALSGVAVGDPRIGALARIWGQPDRGPISIHAGGYVWIPVGGGGTLVGDPGFRGMPQIVLAGFAVDRVRWALSAGVLFRGVTSVGRGPASSVGSELQLRAGIAWGDARRRFNVGPEAAFSTAITGDNALAAKATSFELLLGGQYNIARQVQVGLAAGVGLVPALGTPDARAIFRVAWAPQREQKIEDKDHDGVPDAEDLCPATAGSARARGCPDADADGVPDAEDLCPETAAGTRPDPSKKGCARDADDDGVPDAEDLCPERSAGAHPDKASAGCPMKDSDEDGTPDAEDLCPKVAAGARPDKASAGCPMKDSDEDGVPDAEDLCPNTPPGKSADPKRRGCPLPDADDDGIPDAQDACPNLAGGLDPDAKKSGCPKLVAKGGESTQLKSVHFDTNKAVLLPESFPILDELVRLLQSRPDVKKLVIAGHADDTGTHDWNLRLSRHRAGAVVRYLVKKGIRPSRLRPVGYGDRRPLGPDRSDEARAKNRRVEMRVPEVK